MTLFQLEPSAKAPWTSTIFLTGDEAGFCAMTAPPISREVANRAAWIVRRETDIEAPPKAVYGDRGVTFLQNPTDFVDCYLGRSPSKTFPFRKHELLM